MIYVNINDKSPFLNRDNKTIRRSLNILVLAEHILTAGSGKIIQSFDQEERKCENVPKDPAHLWHSMSLENLW